MRMRTAVLGGLVMTLAVAGCGSADEEPVATVEDPLAAVQAASAQTTEVRSFRASMQTTVESSGNECIDGLVDLVPDAEVAVDGAGEQFRVETSDTTTGATGRLVDGTVYVQSAALPGLSSPTPWVSIDADDVEEHLGLSGDASLPAFSMLGDAAEGELVLPTLDEMLDELDGEGVTVTEVGTGEVRGEPTTHYLVTLDPASAAPTSPTEAAEIEVWVGNDGYVRRLTSSTPATALPSFGGSDAAGFTIPAMAVEVEMWDLGAAIPIEAPPADEVTPLRSLDTTAGGPLTEGGMGLPEGLIERCLADLTAPGGLAEGLGSLMPSEAEWDCLGQIDMAELGEALDALGDEAPTEDAPGADGQPPATTFPGAECFDL